MRASLILRLNFSAVGSHKCEAIKAHGGKQLSEIWNDREPHSEFKMVYCQDPWGTLVEIHTHDYIWVQGWRG